MIEKQISNNAVGTPAGLEKNCNSVTAAQTIPKTHAAPAVAVATKRATPLIKAAHDAEVRRWLNASLFTRMCQTACRMFLCLIYRVYFRFSVSGLEHVPAKGPLIIVSNHSSHLDFGALIVALKKLKNTIHPVSARDYFFNTPFRCWASHVLLNALPFDRQSYFGESITFVLGVIRHGHSVIYFPEGSRTSGVIRSFKHGIGLLAVESGVPVLPAYISGTCRSLPKGKVLPLPYRVCVRFGAPVVVRQPEPDESPSEFVRRVTVDVQHAVEVLSNQPTTPFRGRP
jgi:1-acyl-sn-glycerol-3-phosphate acyltransferase